MLVKIGYPLLFRTLEDDTKRALKWGQMENGMCRQTIKIGRTSPEIQLKILENQACDHHIEVKRQIEIH